MRIQDYLAEAHAVLSFGALRIDVNAFSATVNEQGIELTFAEFLLLYENVRTASSPRETLLEFLQSAYDAGANLAAWDRAALERT